MQTTTCSGKIVVTEWDGLLPQKYQKAKQQGEQYAEDNRDSDILPFPAVCNPAGETGRCGEKIHGEDLKDRLQHGEIINECDQNKYWKDLISIMKDAVVSHGINFT